MANNVTLNSGSGGATLATDDVTDAGGAHYQIIKLADGTENSTTVIAAGGGVEANALRVTVASDSTGVLSVDDNGGSLTVDNAALSQTGGGTEASALRVTLASDSTGVLSVDDNGGSLTIDNAALSQVGGGTEAAALRVTIASDSTGVLSVDDNGSTLSIDDGGASLTVDNATLSVTGGGTETGALRVTLANDSTGVISVDDNGGSLTVDVGTSLPSGTNNIGDVDIASIAAGSTLIGDVGISGARTSGGTTFYRNIDVDETEDQIKATGGQIYWIHAMNMTASPLYLHFYNATSASVTVGATTPDMTFPLPTQATTDGAGFTLSIPNGIAFSTAMTISCTSEITGLASPVSGPAVNGCVVNLGYA